MQHLTTIQMSLRDFLISRGITPKGEREPVTVKIENNNFNMTVDKWDIQSVERFLEKSIIPSVPIKLNSYTRIIDPQKFISSHLTIANKQNGNPTFLPYFKRLLDFKEIIISGIDVKVEPEETD